MKPTILIIPGFWEGPPAPFSQLTSLLSSPPGGYSVLVHSLPSTGTTSPGNPSMDDDIASIRSAARKLVEEEGKDVVLVVHSVAGSLGPAAIEGLEKKEREGKGKKGGVGRIVFFAAAVTDVGYVHAELPFFKTEGGARYCHNPEMLLFNGLSKSETEKWMKELKPQPSLDWDGAIKYAGWKNVPSVFLVCEKDEILVEEAQLMFAEMAGSKIIKCEAGHMAQLSMPKKVAEVVRDAAEELEKEIVREE